jgi:hypothetical protein
MLWIKKVSFTDRAAGADITERRLYYIQFLYNEIFLTIVQVYDSFLTWLLYNMLYLNPNRKIVNFSINTFAVCIVGISVETFCCKFVSLQVLNYS